MVASSNRSGAPKTKSNSSRWSNSSRHGGNATWLLTETDPDEPDLAFGLCDLGMGFPELGSFSITELTSVAGPFGLKIERDLHFTPKKTLSAYASEASTLSRINA